MSIEDDVSFFQRVPTLNQLSRQALRVLAIGAQSRYVHGGEILFEAGERADGAYVIQEGRFLLAPGGAADGKEVQVGPGTLLGEVALVTEGQRPATATAVEPATVMYISRALFLKMLDSFPETARKLRDVFVARLQQTTGEIADVRTVLDSDGNET
jgi:CRP-like cAMP-binding protein